MAALALNAQRQQSVEFVVKPTEDLFLEGSLRRLPRVSKGEVYPCQMQKNQVFSCLFRHYAKHNGLKKEDLVFSFVDELLPDQTPESVHLMPSDEIFVSLRKPIEKTEETIELEKKFSAQIRKLLHSSVHSDVSFVLDSGNVCIPAHKAILSARSEYFESMLRTGGMSESLQSEIVIEHDVHSFKRMMEYLYGDEIDDIDLCGADDIFNLLVTANQFVLEDMRIYVEPFASKLLTVQNVASFLLLSADKEKSALKEACIQYISDHRQDLASDSAFYREVESNPELGLLLFKYAVHASSGEGHSDGNVSEDGCRKRPRYSNDIVGISNAPSQQSTNTIAHSNANVQDL